MSQEQLSVRTRIEEINVDRDGSGGYVDVRYWLDKGEDLLGVATVRVYYMRSDITLDALKNAALIQGHQILSQIVQHYKPDPNTESPEQLWAQ